MNRGCIIALVAALVTGIVLVVVVIVVPLVVFQIITSADPVPVSTYLSDQSVIALRFDPNQEHAIGIWKEAAPQNPNLAAYMLPYEIGMVVDLDSDRARRMITLIGSPRHFGPLFMFMLGNTEAFPADQLIQMPGIDDWEPDTFTRDGDAILLTGTGAVSESARQLAAERWPEPAAAAVLLEGGHCIELAISNGAGEGYLALEPFLAQMAEERPAEPAVAGAAPPQPDGSREDAAPEPPEHMSARMSMAAVLREILLNASRARLTGDFVDSDTLRFRLEADSDRIEFPEGVKPLIEAAITSASERDLPEYLRLTGTVTVDGGRLVAEYNLTGFRDHLVSEIRRGMQ